jgi:NDP-sugar pyrophosphorylase family protein
VDPETDSRRRGEGSVAVRAMILAAGEGTRLGVLTATVPKPMLPVAGRPVLEHLLDLLRRHGIIEVAVNLHYLPQAITSRLGNGRTAGVRIAYSYERELLGSAGALKKLECFFSETFLVLYGDVLTDLDLTALRMFHRKRGAALTMALHRPDDPTRCGMAEIDERGRVLRFREKPPAEDVFSPWASAGVFVVEPEVLRFIPPGRYFDLAADLFPLLLEESVALYGYPSDAHVLDIGSPERYRQAGEHLARIERAVAGAQGG